MRNWILVVEDEDEIREALVDILNESGFTAIGRASAVEAFNVIVETPPALVLSDINLGDHNGGELLDMAMKILGPDAPPFVFVTGLPASDITGVPRSARILRKPVDVDTLLDVATTYCRRAPGIPTVA